VSKKHQIEHLKRLNESLVRKLMHADVCNESLTKENQRLREDASRMAEQFLKIYDLAAFYATLPPKVDDLVPIPRMGDSVTANTANSVVTFTAPLERA
jgi:hypothetical protein